MPINFSESAGESVGQLRALAESSDSVQLQRDGQTDEISLAKTVRQVQENPLLLRKLSNRVYELLLEDMKNQQERARNYGGSF